MEHSGFDGRLSGRLKKKGMEQAEDNALSALTLARRIAVGLAEKRPDRLCNADDVGRRLKAQFGIDTLGPAAGSLFRGKEWIFTGDWIKSVRISNHARMIRVWRLRLQR